MRGPPKGLRTFARLSRAGNGGPDLMAGGPKRTERQGVVRTDTGMGNALTGLPSGSPGS